MGTWHIHVSGKFMGTLVLICNRFCYKAHLINLSSVCNMLNYKRLQILTLVCAFVVCLQHQVFL